MKNGFRGFQEYLSHLAYDYRANVEHASAPATWLRANVTDAMISALTRGQWDRLERTVAALMGALASDALVKQGYTKRTWRPTSARQPGVRKLDGYGSRYCDWDRGSPGWRDHVYRLTRKGEDGATHEYFVSEPYDLNEDGLRSLVRLMDEGWSVSVGANWALHYPGSTMRVMVWKEQSR